MALGSTTVLSPPLDWQHPIVTPALRQDRVVLLRVTQLAPCRERAAAARLVGEGGGVSATVRVLWAGDSDAGLVRGTILAVARARDERGRGRALVGGTQQRENGYLVPPVHEPHKIVWGNFGGLHFRASRRR